MQSSSIFIWTISSLDYILPNFLNKENYSLIDVTFVRTIQFIDANNFFVGEIFWILYEYKLIFSQWIWDSYILGISCFCGLISKKVDDDNEMENKLMPKFEN